MQSSTSYDFLEPAIEAEDLGQLGHYRILSELGRGGMGFVFRARDVKLERTVALKVMNQKIASVPNSRQRFLTEARSMAAVHHDNVVTIFEVGESQGTPFMAMEILAGQTLETYNKSNPQMGFEKIIEFAKQIACGLGAAHVKGIVHRDIKPANIWIQEGTGRVKILDFGLALASTPIDHLAGRGAVIGTPGYLSPEQARSDAMDDRSDLYSLGVVLYEMSTGRLPIQSKSVPGQLVSILAHRPQPIGELNPDIPQPLCDLIHKLLRKEPRLRPSSAAKLQDELGRVEVECFKTTETALAINRLKEGLSEVVTKKSAVPAFESFEEFETVHDPLANSGVMATLPTAAVSMVASPGHPSAIGTALRPPVGRSSKVESVTPAWKAYLPLIAIVALVLIALPILTYVFTSAGRNSQPYIISQAESEVSQSPPSPQPQQQVAPEPAKVVPPKPSVSAPNNASGTDVKTEPPKQAPKKNKKPGKSAVDAPSSGKSAPSSSTPTNSTPSNSAVSMSTDSSATSPVPPSATEIEEPVPTRWIPISTSDGKGADSRVQNGGGGDKNGSKPSIGIQTRGGIETVHSYIRFDLTTIKEERKYVDRAGLILTLVRGERPVGAKLRIYGLPEVKEWPEMNLHWDETPSSEKSKKPLEQFEVLAELDVSADGEEWNAEKNQLRISDPRLAAYIVKADDFVTFALTGSFNDSQLLFVSKEKSEAEAPHLLVEVPVELPKSKK